MTMDEMELLSRLRDVPPISDAASARARVVLQAAVVVEGRDQTAPCRPSCRWGRVRVVGLVRRHRVPAAAAAVVVVAALAAGGMVVAGPGAPRRPGSGPAAGSGSAAGAGTTRDVLYRLASAAVDVPATSGRYVVLSESDTETGYPGQLRRTSVVDTVTGASTTYQQAFSAAGTPVPNSTYRATTPAGTTASTPGSGATAAKQAVANAEASTPGPPPQLTAGADPTQTAAWFASLPTTPAALRAKLLALATHPSGGIAPALDPTFTDDDYVYQEADTMLWSPVISPTLRSALYKVLAHTSGYTVANGTDPAGRPAVVMTRTYSGSNETDITYEDPSTGAVLAQVWKVGKDVISAVYQPVTGSTSPPGDPYTS